MITIIVIIIMIIMIMTREAPEAQHARLGEPRMRGEPAEPDRHQATVIYMHVMCMYV